ncbi:AlbA family DNA-binding domain-containing protein [Demequina maris]|uniref:AlbA family DNA-binding domain-containing protein n=1 Tax=Demequina maris TaxID=1638982 RepID=UPI00078387FB|nr:ATP-binding protein [Demequina maris]
MTFTALHRALGLPPTPFTDAILDDAVAAGVAEAADLDWKSELPPAKGLPTTDFPKDVAAMANSGGGIIVFGVREAQKAATERVDVGDFTEAYERTLRSAAITAITPPVFGLNVHRVGDAGRLAVIVEVPASVDGPHLIYKNDYFAAPVRNDSDTVWMKERQIEAMYRARFDERRHANDALDTIYNEAAAGRDTDKRAWLIAAAHPRIPRSIHVITRDEARAVLRGAAGLTLSYANRSGIHPVENVDLGNPRPGLRRWVAPNTATGEKSIWREAWVGIHHDGSVTVATAIGGHRRSFDGYNAGGEVESVSVESAVADLMALVRKTAQATHGGEYEVRVGIEWAGEQPLRILTKDSIGFTDDGVSTPLHRFSPVKMTVDASGSDDDFHWDVHDLARDCVNQGGISNLLLIQSPQRDAPS